MADRRRIVQVLSNLLSNAVRYSPEWSTIRVTASQEHFHVAVSIADEGRSVPAERLPHRFRKFSRLDGEDGGRDFGGEGSNPTYLEWTQIDRPRVPEFSVAIVSGG